MTRQFVSLLAVGCVALLVSPAVQAGIISITSTADSGLDPVAAEVALVPFGEDADAYVDRTHEHNGARIDDATGLLTTNPGAGTTVVPLPSYLVGAQYIQNAEDNRSAVNYTLTIDVDTPSFVYLLVDNRLDGPAGDKNKNIQ